MANETTIGFSRRQCIVWVAVAGLLSLAFPITLMFAGRERIVGFVADDAYYYYNVATHLAAGEGPTADGVTRTTGFHPLYAFLLAGLHGLTRPGLDAFVAQAILVNAVGSILAGVFLGLCARDLWGTRAGWIAAVLWWTNPHAAHIVADGLEGGLYACALGLFLWRAAALCHRSPLGCEELKLTDPAVRATASTARRSIDPAYDPAREAPRSNGWARLTSLLVGLCAALAVLSRTDALLIVAMVTLAIAATMRRWSARLAIVASVMLMVMGATAAWWWYSWRYTGSIVQGSAAVKREWNTFLRVQQGSLVPVYVAWEWFNYALKCALKVPALKWAIVGIPLLLERRRSARVQNLLLSHILWLAPLLLGIAYCALLDRPRTWYYVPALACFTLLAAGAVDRFLTLPARNPWHALCVRRRSWFSAAVLAECVGIFLFQDASMLWRESDQVQGVRAAAWLEANVPPGARVGCWHSGIVQYYTPRVNVINLDGLANNDILAVLRKQKTMNFYWDEMGITRILGGPREKMGGYELHWNGRHLETCGLNGKLQCVVADDPSAGS